MNWKCIGFWGIVLGVVCVAWQLVMGLTGWYADPVLASVFLLVVVFEIVILVLALRATRADQGYGKQVLTGLLVGVVGGVIIAGGSLFFTAVIAPDYQEEVAAMQEQVLVQRGQDAQVAKRVADRTRSASDRALALQGLAGTVITALVVSLIAAAFLRRKKDAPVVDEKWSAG